MAMLYITIITCDTKNIHSCLRFAQVVDTFRKVSAKRPGEHNVHRAFSEAAARAGFSVATLPLTRIGLRINPIPGAPIRWG